MPLRREGNQAGVERLLTERKIKVELKSSLLESSQKVQWTKLHRKGRKNELQALESLGEAGGH